MNRNATFKVYDRPNKQLSKYQQVANERFSDLYSLQPPDTSKQKYFTDNKKVYPPIQDFYEILQNFYNTCQELHKTIHRKT
jgi:hypothetical protein